MRRHSFIAKIRPEPGTLREVAATVAGEGGNITRIHYDRQIDSQAVFLEVTGNEQRISGALKEAGFLRTSLTPLQYLNFGVRLPHRPGALEEFLGHISVGGATVTSLDFDERGSHPDLVSVSLNLMDNHGADELMEVLKSLYPIDITEYDTTGRSLDKTVFYLRFAQQIRPFLEEKDEAFLLSFLGEINHTVQELQNRGEEPAEIFSNVLEAGTTLNATTGEGFYADVQSVNVNENLTVHCFQPPAGGSIYILESPEESVMLDTGYAIYHEDLIRMLRHYNLWDEKSPDRIITSHGDADHCGAGGFFDLPAFMTDETREIIRTGNRALGSVNEDSVLEEVYTTMIALFSKWNPPHEKNIRILPAEGRERRSIFPVIEKLEIGGTGFEVLKSLGGHQAGQIFLFSPDAGLLFTSDALMNFTSLTEERKRYNSIADYLITSVNVDSEKARKERRALLTLADDCQKETGRPCLICGGHGTISVLRKDIKGGLATVGEVSTYRP